MNPPRTENIIERRIYTPLTATREIGWSPRTWRRLYNENKLAAVCSRPLRFTGQQAREAVEGRPLPSIENRNHQRSKQGVRRAVPSNIPGA